MTRLYTSDHEAVRRISAQLDHLAGIGSEAFRSKVRLDEGQIAELVETAFWATIASDEGRPIRGWVAVAAVGETPHESLFEKAIPFTERDVAKLSQAIPSGGCLIVSTLGDQLVIHGLSRSRPRAHTLDAVHLELVEPGLVRFGIGSLMPFAVLRGRVDEEIEGTPFDIPAYVATLLRRAHAPGAARDVALGFRESRVLLRIAREMVTAGHGGTVAVVPAHSAEAYEYIEPFHFRFSQPDRTIPDIIRGEFDEQQSSGSTLQRIYKSDLSEEDKFRFGAASAPRWTEDEALARPVAALSGVDGAIVLGPDLSVVGFGAMLTAPSVTEVCLFGPQSGMQSVKISSLEEAGGSRHQSAVKFAAANRESVLLVASQDRHLSVVAWDATLGRVSMMRNVEWRT